MGEREGTQRNLEQVDLGIASLQRFRRSTEWWRHCPQVTLGWQQEAAGLAVAQPGAQRAAA